MDDQQIVDALADVWGSMQELGAGLDETEWKLPTDCPGWSVQDNLAHIVGIESVILGRPEPAIELPDLPHVKNDLGRSNEIWVESLRSLSGAELLDRFRDIAEVRLAALRSLTEADWAAPSWTPIGPGTVRDMVPFRVLDSFIHELDMRRAVHRTPNLESPSGAFVEAYGMHDAQAVALEPVPEPIVGGVDAALHMDADTFVRLIGGRGELDELAALVRLEGDTRLGRRVIEHMNVLM